MQSENLLSLLLIGSLFTLPVAAAEETATATSTQPMFGDYQAVGFLSDYSKIPRTGSDDGSYEYTDTTVDFSKYNKLLVDRIKIFFKDDSSYKGIDPDELKALTDYFYEAINAESTSLSARTTARSTGPRATNTQRRRCSRVADAAACGTSASS